MDLEWSLDLLLRTAQPAPVGLGTAGLLTSVCRGSLGEIRYGELGGCRLIPVEHVESPFPNHAIP